MLATKTHIQPTEKQIDFVLHSLNFKPTGDGQRNILYTPNRIILIVGGVRSGKSKVSATYLLTRFPFGKLYWLVGQDYGRTSEEFRYICEGLSALGFKFEASKGVDPGKIEVEGGFIIETKSAQDPLKLAAKAPDGIVICEASQVDYETFLRCQERLVEKRGWLIMAGTMESSLGYYPELFERWQTPNEEDAISFSLPTWSNTVLFSGENDPELLRMKATMSEEWWLERFAGIPCPPKGRVFTEFSMKVHVGTGKEYDFEPTLPVYIFVDPGYASAYSVLAAQKHGEHLYLIDEIYEKSLITSDIIKICKQKAWYNQIISGAIDVAATQHQANVPVSDIWSNEAGIPLISQRINIKDGIELVKRYLIVNPVTGSPLIHINAKCKGLISEFGGAPNPLDGQTKVYSWKLDGSGNVIGDIPEDKYNHSCKALGYGLAYLYGFTKRSEKRKVHFY